MLHEETIVPVLVSVRDFCVSANPVIPGYAGTSDSVMCYTQSTQQIHGPSAQKGENRAHQLCTGMELITLYLPLLFCYVLKDLNTTVALRPVGNATVRILGMAKAPKSRDRATTRERYTGMLSN